MSMSCVGNDLYDLCFYNAKVMPEVRFCKFLSHFLHVFYNTFFNTFFNRFPCASIIPAAVASQRYATIIAISVN